MGKEIQNMQNLDVLVRRRLGASLSPPEADFSLPMLGPGDVRRRLAAIPLPGVQCDTTLPVPEPQLVQPGGNSTLLTLGGVSAALVCLGCALKWKFFQVKRKVQARLSLDTVKIEVHAAARPAPHGVT